MPDRTLRRNKTVRPAVAQIILSLGRGGLETMATNLAVGLEKEGVRSVLIALDEGGGLEATLESAGVEYVVLNGRRFRDPTFHLDLARHLRRLNAQIVHTHMFAPLLHSLPAATLAGVKRVVHTEHSFEYLEPRPSLRRTLRWMSRATSAFTLVGERMVPFYVETVRVSPKRLQVITNGIDPERYRPAEAREKIRSELGLPPDTFVVGSAGRLAPEKNYAMLLRAAGHCRSEGTRMHVALFGDGVERAALGRLAAALGIEDSVSFLGWRSDLHRVLGGLDVFVLTSDSEGLPLALLEAMATGLPVVSTPVGDITRVVVEGRSGYFVPNGDAHALARLLTELSSASSERKSMGDLGRRLIVEHHSHATMVRRYMNAYALQ